MRWPFRRSFPSNGSSIGNPAAIVRADGATGAWRELPPLQRITTNLTPIASASSFRASLSAHQDPRFLAPLGHAIASVAEVSGHAPPRSWPRHGFPTSTGSSEPTTETGVAANVQRVPDAGPSLDGRPASPGEGSATSVLPLATTSCPSPPVSAEAGSPTIIASQHITLPVSRTDASTQAASNGAELAAFSSFVDALGGP